VVACRGGYVFVKSCFLGLAGEFVTKLLLSLRLLVQWVLLRFELICMFSSQTLQGPGHALAVSVGLCCALDA
jgi:hypothetical protein